MQSSNQTVQIRVLNASTGVCYPMALHGNELTRDSIQRHLAAIVPKNDQILLYGPPYKVLKDSHLRSNETLAALSLGDHEDDPNISQQQSQHHSQQPSLISLQQSVQQQSSSLSSNNIRKSILQTTEQTGSKRIFLFSKRALSENAPDPIPCNLASQTSITLPTQPDPSPISYNNRQNDQTTTGALDGSATSISVTTTNENMDEQMQPQQQQQNVQSQLPSSPLHQALSIYERRFMLHLCQGRALADGADMRLSTTRKCIAEQAVMVRALRAAVSNLSDHWNNATRIRVEFTEMYVRKMESHSKLLNGFDGLLEDLGRIELDQSLKAIARVNGRIMETLLDTVPVDRMRKWAGQCQTGYHSLQHLFAQLEQAFDELHSLYDREEDAKADLNVEKELRGLEEEVETIMVQLRDEQAKRLIRLTEDHKVVVSVVLNAVQDEGRAQAAFTTLESMSKASTAILPSMEEDDSTAINIMNKVADAKTAAMKRMKVRLRQISVAQNRLGKVQTFAGTRGTLRDTLNQHCEDMAHLEHLVELPASYRDFLSEVIRRRAYGEAVSSTTAAVMERLTTMRNDEVRAREKFVRGPGRHLMPSFFEMFVPTLATPPPLFAPQLPAMVEMDTLPNVRCEATGLCSSLSNAKKEQIEDASLTESLPNTMESGDPATNLTESVSRLSVSKSKEETKVNIDTTGEIGPADDQNALIVSVDGSSGNDVVMAGSSKAEDDAERKTLAYENVILRQALDRMGGKSSKTYLDEGLQKDEELRNVAEKKCSKLQKELDKMREEVNRTKSQLEQTSTALADIKKDKELGEICDRISHSSFRVGDVALFMPTGRGSGGRRTYVAFHSNCPHRFLSTDSIDGKPDYVLGRVVYQEELVAGTVGTDANPHGLIAGTKFWILTVEVMKLGGAGYDSSAAK